MSQFYDAPTIVPLNFFALFPSATSERVPHDRIFWTHSEFP